MDTVTEMLNTTKCSQENCREISTNVSVLQDKVDSWPSAGTESVCQCTDQIAGLETLLYEVYIYLHIYILSTYLHIYASPFLHIYWPRWLGPCVRQSSAGTQRSSWSSPSAGWRVCRRRWPSPSTLLISILPSLLCSSSFILPQGDHHQPDQVLRCRVWADVRAAGQRGQHCRLSRHRAGQLGRQYPGCAVVFMLQRLLCQK